MAATLLPVRISRVVMAATLLPVRIARVVMAATLLPVPKYAITELNSMAFSFIWGRRDKIHREMVIKPISEGGLGMVDIEKLFDSFKAFWLKRLLSSDNIVDS